MPRRARRLSSTNIYHVVIKGIDKQLIFEDQKDYYKYIEILELYKEECHFMLYAYCLMSNHVHLVIQITDISMDTIFRKINTHYAVWFNMKYKRTGHLQDGRYFSEPVEDEEYLLSAIRYVHFNPTKAGLESSPGQSYPWNSIYEYIRSETLLVDTDVIYEFVDKESFIDFTTYDEKNACLDVDNARKRTPDDVAKDIIEKECGCKDATEFLALPLTVRNANLRKLFALGLSSRQLNRLTGVPQGVIQRVVSKKM